MGEEGLFNWMGIREGLPWGANDVLFLDLRGEKLALFMIIHRPVHV